MDTQVLQQFVRLASALSPENLHCDGEISRAAARRKEKTLRAEWKRLEQTVGRTVTEDEVWSEWQKSFVSRSQEKRVNTLIGVPGNAGRE